MSRILLADIETRSRADLKVVGQRRYAKDPSTQITTATWRFLGETRAHQACFIPAFQDLGTDSPQAFLSAVASCDFFVAHNVAFDANVITEVYKVPIPIEKIIDTMARAQALALPGGLDQLCRTLGVPGKLDAGKAIVMATCKPQKDGSFLEDRRLFGMLLTYNVQDLDALQNVFAALPPLDANEEAIFKRTWRKNSIGLPIDLQLTHAIAERKAQIDEAVSDELSEITGGMVTAVSQRQRIIQWFASREYPLDNTRKETIEEALDTAGDNVPSDIIRVLEIVTEAGGTAPTKANAVIARHVNGWYLDGTRYFGARSGRGTSEGVNTFNIARPSGKHNVEDVIRRLKAGDRTLDNVALTDALRGMIAAPQGWKIVDCDEKNGELRISLWFSNDYERLQMLARGDDLYSHNGRIFFGIPDLSKKTHPLERQLSKQATLGGVYGCSGPRFTATVKKDTNVPLDIRRGFTDERGSLIINAFRRGNPNLCAYGSGMWTRLDTAARNALEHPGMAFEACEGRIVFLLLDGTLWLRLPSGRSLPHYNAHIDAFGEFKFQRSKHGHMSWQRSYGGAWTEIICQATLRDIVTTVEAQIEAEIPDAYLLLDIYDSVILLARDDRAEAVQNHVVNIMQRPMPWAPGLPLDGDGYFADRMHK